MIRLSQQKKIRLLKAVNQLINLFVKCGGPGGTMGPCPTGQSSGFSKLPTSYKTRAGEVLHSAERQPDGTWLMGDQKAPDHIQKLGIPPAWKGVKVNPDPKGNLLVRGIDAKGRVQSRYSDNHSMRANADKFGRTSELRKKRGEIFNEVEKDIKSGKNPEEAFATKLIMKTGMRPGSDWDTGAEHKSYGATTLEGRHIVQKDDGSVAIRFVPGKKKGQEIEMPIHDKEFGKQLVERSKEVGSNGRMFKTDAEKVRDYSKSKDGGGFKTKDHRTALGTETAIDSMKNHPVPRTVKEYKAAVKAVSTSVSDVLGNTPSIAFSSYIDPHTWTAWKESAGVK